MAADNIFDSSYVNSDEKTSSPKKQSEAKPFSKEVIKEEEMSRYGSSKPRRIVIKAKITND
jgi:hypothetical protein